MSNQEAIALLRNLEDALDSYCELNEEGKTAFRMAIEAISRSENPNNSDCISRQAAIDAVVSLCDDCDSGYCGSCRVNYPGEKDCRKVLEDLPCTQKKGHTKVDYIMALHKEYGCSLARAEEAHQKALEYLRNTSMMKG
jgi:hypothetical protein